MNLEILRNILPWTVAFVGSLTSLFIRETERPNERTTSNYIVIFSGLGAAISAYLLIPTSAKWFVAFIFLAGAVAALISQNKLQSIVALAAATGASLAWITGNILLSVVALSLSAFSVSAILPRDAQKTYLPTTLIISFIAILGSILPQSYGTLLLAVAVSWFGFLYPFLSPLTHTNSRLVLIIRCVILPLGALSMAHTIPYMMPIAVISLILTAAKTITDESADHLTFLASSSAAILFIIPMVSSLSAIAHTTAVLGAILITGQIRIARFAKIICKLSLAGIPFLGGFWGRWMIIKTFMGADKTIIPIIIVTNTIAWIYSILLRTKTIEQPEDKIIPSPILTAIASACITLVILLGLGGMTR